MWLSIGERLINTNFFDEIGIESNFIVFYKNSHLFKTIRFETKEEAKEEFKRLEKLLTKTL